MKRILFWFSFLVLAILFSYSCRQSADVQDITGAWRSKIQFRSGAFTAIKDLEFMYVFNTGGTMTESSNYDAAPPVPPAYGIWKKIRHHHFQAKYEFYITKAPNAFQDITSGSGWLPAGRGIFLEDITLSKDGSSFTSKIRYDAFDQSGKPAQGGGEATGQGVRLKF